MNVADIESAEAMIAKTCSCRKKNRKVTYSFVHSYHGLCLDKKDIMSAQIEACERLLKYRTDEDDKAAIEKEIVELKMALVLMT
jgi:hypothetical protein